MEDRRNETGSAAMWEDSDGIGVQSQKRPW
jgi:hypothetical protein